MPLIKRHQRDGLSVSPPCKALRLRPENSKAGMTPIDPGSVCFDLRFPASRNVRNNCVCAQLLSHVLLFGTHELQPARLICPWNVSGKNTEVVAVSSSRLSS